ncbi:hypothetical protein, partial [Sphingopyxis sp. BSNA05]|uniref:hypothetical protein n=1 Tax=Sphingopyxis sp. BSNA05 TaxID=1236614 RepID=UPI001C255B5B
MPQPRADMAPNYQRLAGLPSFPLAVSASPYCHAKTGYSGISCDFQISREANGSLPVGAEKEENYSASALLTESIHPSRDPFTGTTRLTRVPLCWSS